MRAHHGLSEAESHTLNARLVLILANHIGDLAVVRGALALARRSLERGDRRCTPEREASSWNAPAGWSRRELGERLGYPVLGV
jgi:Protein of unknown function (DUF2783)